MYSSEYSTDLFLSTFAACFKDAILKMGIFDFLKPTKTAIEYFDGGIAKYGLQDYNGAKEDFSKAIELDSKYNKSDKADKDSVRKLAVKTAKSKVKK